MLERSRSWRCARRGITGFTDRRRDIVRPEGIHPVFDAGHDATNEVVGSLRWANGECLKVEEFKKVTGHALTISEIISRDGGPIPATQVYRGTYQAV